MKTIFLCDKPQKLEAVYPKEVMERLHIMSGVSDRIYTKADVLENVSLFSDTEIIFSTWGMPKFEADEVLRCFPALKCIFYAAGSVQSFARPFLASGVKIFSAWAANAVPVAEYTVAQILLANKGFYAHTRLMAQENWEEAKKMTAAYRGNYNVCVGLIGCGMIGSLVAQMLKSYHLEVLAFDPFLSEEKAATLQVKKVALDTLFSSCSVISNHLANNAQTQGMLNAPLFDSMPPYATFINTGRGAQVIEEDLCRTLAKRQDLTALLDVTYPEPAPHGHPFYSLPNCFMTPHIAGSLGNEVVRMAEYMLEEYDRYRQESPCLYEVTEAMLATMA